MPQGIPSGAEDSGLLEFQPIQLDYPSISPFLGDTWWLETMDWSGNGASSAYGKGRIPPTSSGDGVGFINPPTPPPRSGPAVGEPTPVTEVNPPTLPPKSGPAVGEPTPITEIPVQTAPVAPASGLRKADPASFGTSGREVGKIVAEDARYENFFSEYPVIVIWEDPALYMHFHLLAVPDYRNDPEFVAAARQFSKRPSKATPWLTRWLFSRPNILNGNFSSPSIYVGINIGNMIPESIKKEQRRMDGEEGLCPKDANQWSDCNYAGFYWNSDEFRRMKDKSRWIWQQWQPDWDYLAIDLLSWLTAGGHGPSNYSQFNSSTSEGGFPPVPFDIYTKRAFLDPDYAPAGGVSMDAQTNLPTTAALSSVSPVLYRNYTVYENVPVFLAPDTDNPVMTVRAFIWNKSNIEAIVF